MSQDCAFPLFGGDVLVRKQFEFELNFLCDLTLSDLFLVHIVGNHEASMPRMPMFLC